MSNPATSPARSPAASPAAPAAASSTAPVTPFATRLAICASAASALLYFLFSDGVRNHLAMLGDALRTIAGHL